MAGMMRTKSVGKMKTVPGSDTLMCVCGRHAMLKNEHRFDMLTILNWECACGRRYQETYTFGKNVVMLYDERHQEEPETGLPIITE